jgi:hypothetical protein
MSGPLFAGVAHADPVTFAVAPTLQGSGPINALTDSESVHITMSNLNPGPFAAVQVDECGNTYGDTTPLPGSGPVTATDCQKLARPIGFTTTTIEFDVPVIQTGIGLGNRSCASTGTFSCDLRVTETVNQTNPPLPTPVPIAFAQDPDSAVPMPTTTTASVVGAPVALNSPANVHIAVTTGNNFYQAEGTVTVSVDTGPPTNSTALMSDGTAIVPVGMLGLGPHTLTASFVGNGSYAESVSSSTSFRVINANNIAIGDTTVVEGDTGVRRIRFPVVLSLPNPLAPVTVNYAIHAGTAQIPADVAARSGTLKIPKGATTGYITAKLFPNVVADGDRAFTVVLTSPSGGYDLRRDTGIGTIIDDDAPSPGPVASLGDASIPEGNFGSHAMFVPLTLSQPPDLNTKVQVSVEISSNTAVRNTKANHGDWYGAVDRTITFLPGITRKFVGIVIFSDTKSEPDLSLDIKITGVTLLGNGTAFGIGRLHGTATILSDE